MRIFSTLDAYLAPHNAISLTIGTFDALHLGHVALLAAMEGEERVVVTFSNHPSEVLSCERKRPLLSLSHKLHLLERYGATTVILLPFTKALSEMSAEHFLRGLHRAIPFSSLVLGYDAKIGHNREGDEKKLRDLSHTLSFSLKYLPAVVVEGSAVSSTRIRWALEKGDFKTVTALLGRPYTIRGAVQQGRGQGQKIGFPTLNLSVDTLALPPLGVYAVDLLYKNLTFQGVANLGFAPTVRSSPCPLLEVHLPAFSEEIYGEEVEVTPRTFLREERKFLSLEELKTQIRADISDALI